MSGHSKWAQIKRQKAVDDHKKSKVFGKYGALIAAAVRIAGGDMNAASVRVIVDKAKKENMPKDTIERALKKGASGEADDMEELHYEAYGPGGTALMIVARTNNRNKAAQEVKHALTKNGYALAAAGSAAWAFMRNEDGDFEPNSVVELSDEDAVKLSELIDAIESSDEVESVYTTADENSAE